jgi:export-related chaperone CsaA
MSVPYDAFAQLDIRVGKIVEVSDIPRARKPLYRIIVDFGGEGVKQCAAGIKQYYPPDKLVGKQVVALINLEPRSVAGVNSECMLLASFTDTDLSLLVPDKEMQVGCKVA